MQRVFYYNKKIENLGWHLQKVGSNWVIYQSIETGRYYKEFQEKSIDKAIEIADRIIKEFQRNDISRISTK